ncbi:hypothetical protein MMC25_002634 [Agyrium rufum]|nr:hypothetical protein [Agyrium rufum]
MHERRVQHEAPEELLSPEFTGCTEVSPVEKELLRIILRLTVTYDENNAIAIVRTFELKTLQEVQEALKRMKQIVNAAERSKGNHWASNCADPLLANSTAVDGKSVRKYHNQNQVSFDSGSHNRNLSNTDEKGSSQSMDRPSTSPRMHWTDRIRRLHGRVPKLFCVPSRMAKERHAEPHDEDLIFDEGNKTKGFYGGPHSRSGGLGPVKQSVPMNNAAEVHGDSIGHARALSDTPSPAELDDGAPRRELDSPQPSGSPASYGSSGHLAQWPPTYIDTESETPSLKSDLPSPSFKRQSRNNQSMSPSSLSLSRSGAASISDGMCSPQTSSKSIFTSPSMRSAYTSRDTDGQSTHDSFYSPTSPIKRHLPTRQTSSPVSPESPQSKAARLQASHEPRPREKGIAFRDAPKGRVNEGQAISELDGRPCSYTYPC